MKKWRPKPGPKNAPESESPVSEETLAFDSADVEPPAEAEGKSGSAAPADDLPEAVETEAVPLERLQRLQADFDNYRKRMSRERAEIVSRATEDLMLELLPVLDNFDIALRHADEQSADQAMVDGFRLVAENLETALHKFGLQQIMAEEDVLFDPHLHEAVAHLPDPQRPEGRITAQTRRGFRLGDKLLRAAQVVVSSGKPDEAAAAGASASSREE